MSAVGKGKFNDRPFAYHTELELEITKLTNLGVGLGRIRLEATAASPSSAISAGTSPGDGWVVMVPFALPGERVRARVFRNHRNFSEADLLEVLRPAPERIAPRCPLFGCCGGCQYQQFAYPAQLEWKRRQVVELLEHLAGLAGFPVAPVIGSPREYHYRTKITPHFAAPRRADRPGRAASGASLAAAAAAPASAEDFSIGFLRQGTRFDLVDVPHCPIATEAINTRLATLRAEIRARADSFRRGATLLLREAGGRVTTDYDAVITEEIAQDTPPAPARTLRLRFLARDFFQNNPFLLPAFTRHVREQAAAGGARFLVDAYCGSGLFALTAAPAFARVAGIEISASSVHFARENAAANGLANATFLAGDAAAIFAGLDPTFRPAETAVVIDPPRKGCDERFLHQLLAFAPRTVVYVSCDP
ncbi:MAG: class I SAM-dependent RNA methyltransferase, partial [Verrucomicrobia bacterium]|nr:class I SAM-dependent RNA methyltransferase [Verrucomicrobiota bacterium]